MAVLPQSSEVAEVSPSLRSNVEPLSCSSPSSDHLGVGVTLHVPLSEELHSFHIGGILFDDALIAHSQLLGFVHRNELMS